MKKYLIGLFLLCGSFFFTSFIHADELIIDDAQLFTDSEKTALNKQAEQLSEQI